MPNTKNPANRMVVKSNELIQKSRFSLSLQQQRIVLFLISLISEGDQEFREYQFTISDFLKLCGMQTNNGQNYQYVKDALQALSNKSMWLEKDGVETLVRWLESPKINRTTHQISVRLDRALMPYLLQLKQNFTQYELRWTLKFDSKYSNRLYELLKSVYFNSLEPYSYTFDLAHLRQQIDAAKYKAWQDFKARALEPAIKEINEYSDLNVSYEAKKTGRAVTRIKFTMETKDALTRIQMCCDSKSAAAGVLPDVPIVSETEDGFEPI